MGLKLYNTLTRKLEDFVPINTDRVGVYACGPTVYNYAHIGNGRMAVVFDLLVRVLRHTYPNVVHVSNITDVEDKIMDAAKERGQDIGDITRHYTEIYNQDMAALGVQAPDIQPRATEHIQEMIDLISRLIETNNAYAVQHDDGGQTVLFHVASYPLYGALSGRSRDEQIAGARVEVAPYKKDPADFVLWKPSTADQPGWDSPWGRGRPGWHIECSAMAEKHLGLPFDIHGGGADLKFPHHENEIAQSCCAHQHGEYDPAGFARTWVHNGFVTVAGEKMSKSVGNVMIPHDMIAHGVKGEAIRWALLGTHYRSPLDWNEERLDRAKYQLFMFYRLMKIANEKGLSVTDGTVDSDVIAALEDDLNSSLAMTHLIRLGNQANNNLDNLYLLKNFVASARLMGFLNDDPQIWFPEKNQKELEIADWVRRKIRERDAAKMAKDYKTSDAIRDELLAQGIKLEDSRDGKTTWVFID